MALSDRAMAAALFAEQVVAAIMAKQAEGGPELRGQEVEGALRTAGYSVLGSGCYGAVLSIDTDNVLKVCTRKGDGYPVFAQWAQRNPGPHIPDIFWSIRISEDLFLCAMPKYRALTRDDECRVEALRNQGFHNAVPASSLGRTVATVLAALGKLAVEDMHLGNFMYCPTRGEYIITDPLSALRVTQEEAEYTVTGKRGIPQMRAQAELDFAEPASNARVVNAMTAGEIRGMQALVDSFGCGSFVDLHAIANHPVQGRGIIPGHVQQIKKRPVLDADMVRQFREMQVVEPKWAAWSLPAIDANAALHARFMPCPVPVNFMSKPGRLQC